MTAIKKSDKGFPLRLEWLRSFLAVAEKGGFTRAAPELNLSQPAVWTHVRELEKSLGIKLFDYIGGKARLTRGGEAAAAAARRLLEGVHAFQEAVAESESAVHGVLSLGASTTPGNYLLPPLMRAFERRYPRARTTLFIGNSAKVLQRLEASEVDLAVVGVRPEGGRFEAAALCDDEIVLFASRGHPAVRKRQVSRERLEDERLVVREADSATRRLTDALLLREGLRPSLMELGCPETVKKAVAAGLGLGVLSRFSVAPEIGRRELVEIRCPGFPIRRRLYVAHLRRRHPTRVRTSFLDLLTGR